MQRNHCSSVVLLGAVAALLAGCDQPKEEVATVAAAPTSTDTPSACKPANVAEDLVGPKWIVDHVTCGAGCPHAHLHEEHSFTFTKDGANFDIHGSYETTGGALEVNPMFENEVRGKIPTSHSDGGGAEHWFAAHLYVEDEARCGKPNPYDLKVAVCENKPDSYDACTNDDQHGGFAHSHP